VLAAAVLSLCAFFARAQTSTPNSWIAGAPMPTAREQIFTGVIGQDIYAIGGNSGSTTIGVNEVYNTATNSWTTAASMLTPRWGGATAVVNNILYTFGGGMNSNNISNVVEAYNPATDSWATKSSMPANLNSIYAVVEGGLVYIIGGYNGNRVSSVYAYNPATDTWTTEAPLIVGKSQPAVGLIGSSIIAAGGLNTNSSATTDNESYNAANNSWATLAPLPAPRQAGCFGVLSGQLYFAGGNGSSSNDLLPSVIAYNPATNAWETNLPTIPNELTNPGSAVAGNLLYCIGGSSSFRGTAYNYVQIYEPPLGPPSINAGGVVSASAFGEFSSISPGSWIEIYGNNLAADTRGWTTADFTGINAPMSLDGTSVTIAGQQAFIDYISPGQVNALVPSTVPTGAQQLTVTTGVGTSSSYNITVNATEAGLLSPANFNIGGVQYVTAFIYPDEAFALPTGAMPNARPAVPGDILTLYGVGFGPVIPAIPAGQLVEASNNLALPFQVSIGGVPATVQYAGLAPSYTGLYQFNITVPNAPAGNQPLTFMLNGVAGSQTLYIAVGQ
jgi:uncharacterized protein (TIGR03437 family)